MRVFKNKWFNRWARNEGITDTSLCTAANEMTSGNVEADLGGYLFKKRVARGPDDLPLRFPEEHPVEHHGEGARGPEHQRRRLHRRHRQTSGRSDIQGQRL